MVAQAEPIASHPRMSEAPASDHAAVPETAGRVCAPGPFADEGSG